VRVVVVICAVCFALLAPAADAHVTVMPATARPGQTVTLNFRVLNERSDARTVGIDIFVPPGLHATASDRRGWRRADRPREFSWTATGSGAAIGGSSAKDFEVRVGPLPRSSQVVFKALQHYSDGAVVRWIQTAAGGDRPAPVLRLSTSGQAGGGGGGPSGLVFAVPVVVVLLLFGGAALLRRRPR
jgi:uncharacterized protein YcnI